jgi:hypothetical protein
LSGEGYLDGFRREMQQEANTALEGQEVAVRLCAHLIADQPRFNAPIVDVIRWATNVHIELATGAHWMVECLGANAYHVYPGHIREDGDIVWPNIWVAPDMTLDQTIKQLRQELFADQA